MLTNAHNLRDRTTEVTFAGRPHRAGLRRRRGRRRRPRGRGAWTPATSPPLAWAEDPPAEPGEPGLRAWPARPATGTRVTVGMLSSVDGAFRGPRGRRVTGTLEHTAPLGARLVGQPARRRRRPPARPQHRPPGPGLLRRRCPPTPTCARGSTRCSAASRPQRRTLGIGLAPAEVAAKLRASVGLPERAGLLVRSVDPDGAAARSRRAGGRPRGRRRRQPVAARRRPPPRPRRSPARRSSCSSSAAPRSSR